MKLSHVVFGAGLLGVGMFLGSAVFSQQKSGQADPQAEMMQKWMESMAPGEEHEKLEAEEGTWDATMKMWMMPGAPPAETKGTSQRKMMLGGRFLMDEYKGSMMGMPYDGVGFNGYDKFKKKYTSVWISSMGTNILTMEGTASADGKTITYEGLMDEPMTGEKDKKVRYIAKNIDADNQIFEIHDLALEKMGMSTKVVEISYKRRKASKS